jgi:hypothetical protein
MNLSEFLALEGEFHITPEEAQKLNESLSRISADSLLETDKSRVLDYLIVALNMNSVDRLQKHSLDKLVLSLQAQD